MGTLHDRLKALLDKHNHPYDGILDKEAYLKELEELVDEESTLAFQRGVHAGQESV